jgi:hypothetical protein
MVPWVRAKRVRIAALLGLNDYYIMSAESNLHRIYIRHTA